MFVEGDAFFCASLVLFHQKPLHGAPCAHGRRHKPDQDRRDHGPHAPAELCLRKMRKPDQHERRCDHAEAKLADQRQKIADETFAKAREQLAAFAAGDGYAAWLQGETAALADALGENANLSVRTIDLPLLKGVKLPAGTTLTADDSIELGGLKGANAAKGLAADDTLAARLNAQHEWFLENAGLEINI